MNLYYELETTWEYCFLFSLMKDLFKSFIHFSVGYFFFLLLRFDILGIKSFIKYKLENFIIRILLLTKLPFVSSCLILLERICIIFLSSQLYRDTIDIKHCVRLRCITYWLIPLCITKWLPPPSCHIVTISFCSENI